MDEISGADLMQGDFYAQKCKKCKNQENEILKYNPLKQAESRKPHIKGVCIKCLYFDACHPTGTYLGITT
jgi:hypothetical protein